MMSPSLRARILILPKEDLRDPQGETIFTALGRIGLGDSLKKVTKGSQILLDFKDNLSREQAESQVHDMCEKLLVNPLIESYSVSWEE